MSEVRPCSCSVIIISYNSSDYIPSCIASISDALEGIDSEIIVLDNGSPSPILSFQKEAFPHVKWISSSKNMGFGKGCNFAAKRATKSVLFFVNPDTVVSKGTFKKTLKYMDSKENIGAVGCKILNGDGSLQWACRRSFPSPLAAVAKTIGLAALFPKNKKFASYNMTYLDPNQETEVDAVSGSFFGVKKSIFEEVGGFDEDYFMYGEDLDICLRIKKRGYKNYYFPETSILHFKGQSSKTRRIRSFFEFYMAMLIFAKKHRNYHLPIFIVAIGIFCASIVGIFSRLVPQWWKIMVDLFVVILCVLAFSSLIQTSASAFAIIAAFIWIPFAFSADYATSKLDIARSIKFLLCSAVICSVTSVFVVNLSTMILFPIATSFICSIFWRRLVFWTIYFYNIFSGKRHRSILLGGTSDSLSIWFNRYRLIPGLDLLGCVSLQKEKITEENKEHLLGSVSDIPAICKRTGCREVLVFSDSRGFHEPFDIDLLKSLGLKVQLLIGTENNNNYAVVDLNYFY